MASVIRIGERIDIGSRIEDRDGTCRCVGRNVSDRFSLVVEIETANVEIDRTIEARLQTQLTRPLAVLVLAPALAKQAITQSDLRIIQCACRGECGDGKSNCRISAGRVIPGKSMVLVVRHEQRRLQAVGHIPFGIGLDDIRMSPILRVAEQFDFAQVTRNRLAQERVHGLQPNLPGDDP